jgi:hypothetical protein
MKEAITICLPALLGCGDTRIVCFTRRDLLDEDSISIEELWNLESARQILRKQLPSGCWRYPNARAKEASPLQDYDQLETYRRLGQLVELFGFNKAHPAVERTAGFLFEKQTVIGDFRGIYGRQYTPNYSAGIVELLVKAGYRGDARIEKAFKWLVSMRQEDGGWAIPFRTSKKQFRSRATHKAIRSSETMEPDLTRPSSAMVTGVVLRAFVADRSRRRCYAARKAAELLPPKFFKRDNYIDRGTPEYWESVTFPFWFTDIVSALDSLSLLKPTPLFDDSVSEALLWLLNHQSQSGLFELRLLKTGTPMLKYWESLAVCRILRRYGLQLPGKRPN